jgi:beta-1,2-mannobiose phosphorylase / 1,2-beta-oligomannan phosphorylase
MITVKKHGILMQKTENEFENKAVLNPAIYQEGETLHMFYRGVRADDVSSIGYAKLNGHSNIVERTSKPILYPTEVYESHGIEDPRIVFFEGKYYMFYTAYNGTSALIAYAESGDLMNWEKKGIISSVMSYSHAKQYMTQSKIKEDYYLFEAYLRDSHGQDVLVWDKDAFIFPERINGKIAFVHRILPDIQIAYVDSLSQLKNQDFWINHFKTLGDNVLMEGIYAHELRNIGGGVPPIKTPQGWLMIFHSVRAVNSKKAYAASAALCDLNDPKKILGRTSEPIFEPTEPYEIEGTVNDVVFPTGAAIFGKELYIYYGAADSCICLCSLNLDELMSELLNV